MAESRSDTVHADAVKSGEQFDYFVLALISAIVSYLAQNVTVSLFTSPSYDIYLSSMVMLLISMFYGFMRIEQNIVMKQVNHQLLYAAEGKGELVHALENEPSPMGYLNKRNGSYYTLADMKNRINAYSDTLAAKEIEIEMVQQKCFRYYKIRNRLFLLGFLGVFLAKVLLPYIN